MGKEAEGLSFTLPYPPSINSYYRTFRGRILISKKGRDYRECVCQELHGCEPILGRVAVCITVMPPDRRKRDLDNVQKALLDSIEHAGIIEDDAMIDELHTIRGEVLPREGRVEITITSRA